MHFDIIVHLSVQITIIKSIRTMPSGRMMDSLEYIVKIRLKKGGELVQETVHHKRTIQPMTSSSETAII